MSSTYSQTSLWDSRFDDSGLIREAYTSTSIVQDDVVKISSILAAAGRKLPIIHPVELQPYSHLGSGSCFKVECEIYTKQDKFSNGHLVAVKYLRLPRISGPETSKFYDGVMRELRVLTHPPFRNHECLIEAVAYGWSTSAEVGIHPYLVVEYSDHGTAFEYLQRITPPVDQCRQLAIDVAVGLQALHHSDIIHGDLKTDNVLIFNCAGERPQVAKLADFGASIFEVDFTEGPVSYKGTARYNAPEQEGRLGPQAWKSAQTREGFYKADIYSLGLLIWELMNDGDDFCDPAWLAASETELQFLDRICETEEDGLLSRARLFCESRFRDLEQPIVKQAVLDALEATLRDKAALRADVDKLVGLLAEGTSQARPKPVYPRIRSMPMLNNDPPPSDSGWRMPLIRLEDSTSRQSRRQQKLSTQKIENGASNRHLNVFEEAEKIVRSRQKPTIKLATTQSKRSEESAAEVKSLSSQIQREPAPLLSSRISRESFDIFQVFSTAAFPPWSIQRGIFEELNALTYSSRLTIESADAHFQLSLCYQTGFGVEPDAKEVMQNLRKAVSLNTVAWSVRRRLEVACNDQALTNLDFATNLDDQLEDLMSSPFYFSHRIRIYQKSLNHSTKARTWKCDTVEFSLSDPEPLVDVSHKHDCHQPCVSADTPTLLSKRNNLLDLAAEVGDIALVCRLVTEQSWNGRELASALIKACEYGHFITAKFLASYCPEFSSEINGYSPLHWLIMFNDDESRRLGTSLVLGTACELENANGVCKHMIDAMPAPGSEPIFLPEHCLELAGSPLHWAVGARNLPLVTLLLELGANPQQRWSYTSAPEGDYPSHQRPSCTPFELAITLHLPEIMDVLWTASPHALQGDPQSSSTAVHCIGQVTLPFLRRMIHGANHVQALRDTINTLQKLGLNICCTNAQGQSVFMAALSDPDQEPYVLEEILKTSQYNEEITAGSKNAATLVATTSSRRRCSIQRMILAVGLVADVNDTDTSGWNALHYLAIENSARLCEVLMQSGDVEINKANDKGATAVHIAAMFNAGEVLRLLLSKGANIEILDHTAQSPLAVAVSHRQRPTTKILIEAGADINMCNNHGASKTTVLHIAVSGPSSSESIACHLLNTYPQLQDPAQLNIVDGLGWTPLHRAAYFGDYEGVVALLRYGADSEIRCPRRFPIARGRTALDVTSHLLQRMITPPGLGPDHMRISKGGTLAIAAFKSRLEEIKVILSQKTNFGSEGNIAVCQI